MGNSFFKCIIISIIFLFLIKTDCNSQSEQIYIKPFDQNFSLLFFGANKFSTLLHQYLLEENTFEPNRPISIGIGFVGDRIGLKVGYGFGFLARKDKGNTKSLDIQYHYYGRKLILDATLQRYKGFYIDNEDAGGQFDIYKDLKTIKTGIFLQYVFNHEKFSYRAAYSQRDQQIKSSGSFLLGGGIYYSEIHSDIPYFFNDTVEDKLKLTNFQLGPSIGYAYNFAITKKFYIFLACSGGINIGFNDKFQNTNVYPAIIPRFSMGYNFNSWSINLGYTNDLIYSYLSKDRKIMLSSGSVQLSILKRFNVDYDKIRKKLGVDKIFNKIMKEK